MDGSPKSHALYNEHVKQQQITSGKTALHALSDTRWTACSDNLDTIMNVYPALLSMFQQMSHGGNGTATGLLLRIKQFNFVTACLVLQKCFSLSRHASEYLQNEGMDLLTAVVAIQDSKSAYQAMRSEDELNKLISNSRLFANETQSTLPASEIASPPPKRCRCLPTRFRDGKTIMTGSNSLPWNYSEDDGDSVAYRLRQNFFLSFSTNCCLNWTNVSVIKLVTYFRMLLHFTQNIFLQQMCIKLRTLQNFTNWMKSLLDSNIFYFRSQSFTKIGSWTTKIIKKIRPKHIGCAYLHLRSCLDKIIFITCIQTYFV